MFLFRKRKESAENPEDVLKLEENAKPEKPVKAVKPAGPAKTSVKDSREKASKKAEPAAPAKDPFFQSEDSLQIIESDTPVKVVIPASSLIEDEPAAPLKIKEPEPAGEPVPEEVVDGLFEKVNEGRDEEDEDISLDAILPLVDKKADSKPGAARPAEKAAAPAGEKTRPEAPAQAAKAEVPVQTPPAAGDKNSKAAAETATAAAASALASAASALASATAAAAPAATPSAMTASKAPSLAPEAEKKSGGDGKEKKKGNEEEGKENLFSQLFNKVEEAEETPLDRLIKTLPEISMEEVMNEAEEVKGLMSEWFHNQSK